MFWNSQIFSSLEDPRLGPRQWPKLKGNSIQVITETNAIRKILWESLGSNEWLQNDLPTRNTEIGEKEDRNDRVHIAINMLSAFTINLWPITSTERYNILVQHWFCSTLYIVPILHHQPCYSHTFSCQYCISLLWEKNKTIHWEKKKIKSSVLLFA